MYPMHLEVSTAIPVRIQFHKQAIEQNNMTISDGWEHNLIFNSWNILVKGSIEEAIWEAKCNWRKITKDP